MATSSISEEEELENLKIKTDIVKHEMGEELMEATRKCVALKSRNKDDHKIIKKKKKKGNCWKLREKMENL